MRKHESILTAALVGAALVLAACGTETPGASDGGTRGSAGASSASPSRTTSTPTHQASSKPAQSQASSEPVRSRSSSAVQRRAVDRCHTSELGATVRMRNSAAGHRHAWLVLTNTSRTTCTIYGYGGMQLYGSSGRAVPTKMVRDRSIPPRLVTLAPGESARSSLSWTVVPTGGEPSTKACEPSATRAHVTPPDETSYLSIPWHFGQVCDHGTIDQGAYRA